VGGPPWVTISGDVPAGFLPMPDPVRAKRGVIAISVPDGDEPRTFQFGGGVRAAAG
jgi:hypothetical protein